MNDSDINGSDMDGSDATRLEQRLRASLADRADDVATTPALWHRVSDRAASRTRRRRVLAVAGTALSVAVAAVVVPGLLDRTSERPPVLIDPGPDPAPDGGPGPDGDAGRNGTVDPPATHVVAVLDGALTWFEAADLATPRLRLATDVPAEHVAVRPHGAGDDWHVAYTARSGDDWVLHLLTVADDAVTGTATGPIELAEVATTPALDGVVSPGLAWSPDGTQLAWLVTESNQGAPRTTEVEVIGWQDGFGERSGQYVVGVPIADDSDPGSPMTTGTLRLADWTWDATYEDGMVGRLLLVGEERGWQGRITRDAARASDVRVDRLELVAPLVDFDQAGPVTGALRLVTGHVPQVEDAILAVTDEDDDVRASWTDPMAAVDASADFAAAGGLVVVSLGDRLLRFEGDDFSEFPGSWGAVDLAAGPWSAPYVDADPQPTSPPDEAADDAAAPPDTAVRAVGTRLEVVANWLGEGEPEVVRDLGAAPVFEGQAPIHGVTVLPGSTPEDLEAVALVLNEGMYEFWTVRSGGGSEATWAQFPAQHQPRVAADDPLRPIPVFSEDHPSGDRYLAWVDHDEGGDQTLRIVGWTPGVGPGTGDTADDNTSFTVSDRPLFQLDGWEWTDEDADGWTTAQLTFTAWAEQGQMSPLVNEVDRGPDGAISLGGDCFCGEPGHGSHTHESVLDHAAGWGWLLTEGADGVGLHGWQTGGDPDGVRPTLPPALREHPRPALLELRVRGDTAVVVDQAGATAWVLRNGSLDSFAADGFDFVD